jgi:uncharacterized protein (DUF1810 family)
MQAPVAPDLDRYLDAQAHPGAGIEAALAELRAGAKRGHWIWYVFPQLAGLGRSALARRYAIADPVEARAYLRHPELRARLLAATTAVAAQTRRGRDLGAILGSPLDTMKLVSSLTLFAPLARALDEREGLEGCRALAAAAEEVLARAREAGHPPCAFTLAHLGAPEPRRAGARRSAGPSIGPDAPRAPA